MANVIQFTIQGNDNLSGTLGKVGNSMAKAAKSAAKLVTAGAAVAASFEAFTLSVAKSQDRLGKLSTRLGISTQALSAFHRQASLSGVSTETMNMALQRMGRRVAEAANGTGEAAGALKELNLNARELASLPLDQQMLRVADSLSGVESQSEKVRLAFKLFDSEGVALLQTMENGSEGFRQAAEEAERLGLIVGPEMAARSAEFVDSFDRLGSSVTGVGRGIANAFMPALTAANEALTDFIATNREAAVGAFVGLVRGGIVAFNVVSDLLGRFAAQWHDFWVNGNLSVIENWGSNFLSFIQGQFTALAQFAKVTVVSIGRIFISGFKVVGEVIWTSMKWGWDKFMNFIGQGPEVQALGTQLAVAIRDAAQAEIGNIRDSMAQIVSSTATMAEQSGANIAQFIGLDDETVGRAIANADLLVEKMMGVGQTLANPQQQTGDGAGAGAGTGFIDPLAEEQKRIDERALLLESERLTQQEHEAQMMAIRQHGLTAITDMVEQQQGAQAGIMADSFSTMLTSVSAFSKTAFKIQKAAGIANAIVNAYTGIALTMSKYPYPINIGMAAAHAVGAFAQVKAIKSQKFGGARVTGGAVTGGSSYLVGENGPELFTPNDSGRITNNEGISGGSVVVENLNVSVLPNATNADALLNMSAEQMERVVAGPIIRALNSLFRQGIAPEFTERLAV